MWMLSNFFSSECFILLSGGNISECHSLFCSPNAITVHWHRPGCCYKYSTLKGAKITFYLSSVESRNSNDKSPHKLQKHSYKSRQIFFLNQGVSENNHVSHIQYEVMSEQTNFLWKHGNWVSQQKRNSRDVHFGIAKAGFFVCYWSKLWQ